MQAKPVKIGPIGGDGGTSRDIQANNLPRTLEKIEIWSSADGPDSNGVINGIRFTYVDTSGKRHIVPNSTSAWGSTDNNSHEVRTTTMDPPWLQYILMASNILDFVLILLCFLKSSVKI